MHPFGVESLSGNAESGIKPRQSWSDVVFPTFPQQGANIAISDGSGPTHVLQHLASPLESFFSLKLPAPHISQNVTLGHIGPWSRNTYWPALTLADVQANKTKHSPHVAFASIPGMSSDGSSITWGGRKTNLGARGEVYAFPLDEASLAPAIFPLSHFVADPQPFLDSLKGGETIIVQERKLWSGSASIGAEFAALGGVLQARANGTIIAEMPWTWAYLILLAAAILACAFLTSPRHFLPIASIVLVCQIIAAPFLLATQYTLLPWSQIAFVYLPATLIGGMIGIRQDTIARILMRERFHPAFPRDTADKISESIDPSDEDSATKERLVTLVDIDVVGFSTTVENTLPEDSTRQISDFLNAIFSVIHEHNGFVSDHSPERLLAVFGHGIGDKRKLKGQGNHVRSALLCATAVQKKSVELMHAYGAGVMSPFPVRIAINSSMVRLGLVQIGDKVEFKTIGAGVALARQLSAHCEPFRILLSSSSAELLKVEEGDNFESLGLERSAGLGGSPDLTTVFELDPFADDRETLNHATEIFRSFNKIKREDNRFGFPLGAEPIMRSSMGPFEILDFSQTGLRLRSRTFLTSGSSFQIWPAEFDDLESTLRMSLTVHWGAPDEASPAGRERFILGVRYTGHSQDQLSTFVAYFHKKLALSQEGFGQEKHSGDEDEEAS
jgi:class 3 adenylate cyclase